MHTYVKKQTCVKLVQMTRVPWLRGDGVKGATLFPSDVLAPCGSGAVSKWASL